MTATPSSTERCLAATPESAPHGYCDHPGCTRELVLGLSPGGPFCECCDPDIGLGCCSRLASCPLPREPPQGPASSAAPGSEWEKTFIYPSEDINARRLVSRPARWLTKPLPPRKMWKLRWERWWRRAILIYFIYLPRPHYGRWGATKKRRRAVSRWQGLDRLRFNREMDEELARQSYLEYVGQAD